jgi:hypothetical protein
LTPRMCMKLPEHFVALIKHTLECDSLADGVHRRPRDGNVPCECKDDWGGVNCNGV